jgi:hypothetical protein
VTLSAWAAFFTTTGSSAAALTGLMFVVITLVRDFERAASEDGIGGFSTPTVVHFSFALLISALLCAPWPRTGFPGGLVAAVGIGGIVVAARAGLRMLRMSNYVPDAEDRFWYVVAPLVAYAVLLSGGLRFIFSASDALFEVAGSVLLLIFIGIRNAWDVVTFLAKGGPDAH